MRMCPTEHRILKVDMIACAEALKGLSSLPDESMDVSFADPPKPIRPRLFYDWRV